MNSSGPHIGHLVLLLSFVANSITSGMGYANSAFYYGHWLESFHQQSWLTSMIGSANIAAVCLTGPFSGMLINRLGYRLTIIIGGVLSVVGLISSAYSQSLETLMATYLLAGVGWGLAYIPVSLAYVHYFEPKYHGICSAIVATGSGFGHFVTPPIAELCAREYTWRGSMLIQAGISANILVLSAALRYKPTMLNDSKSTLKLKLFKNTNFLWLLAHTFLFTNSLSVVFVHLAYTLQSTTGMNYLMSGMCVSVLGLASIFGKLLHGILSKLPSVNAVLQTLITCVLAGVSTLITPVITSVGLALFMSAILGVCIGPYGTVIVVIVLSITETQNAPSAYGYLNFAGGIGLYTGAPIAGFLYDTTKTYKASMDFSGCCFILSGLVLSKMAHHWQKRMAPITEDIELLST